MKNNRIKGFSIAGALLVVILAALGYWIYYCLNPSRERVMAARATIKAYSHYELRQDGKLVLCFDEDTVSLAANFMNRWTLIPSCGGRLAAAYNSSISKSCYQKVDADTLLKEKVDSLDSVYTDSKWKVGELNYYLHSHSVQDLGYNPISGYTQREIILRDSARKMLDSLKQIRKKGHVKLVRCISYKAFFRQADGKWASESCELLKAMDGRNTAGLHLFRLTSETTPDGVAALSPRLASSLAKTHGTTLRRSINYKLKPDSLGYYEGAFDSLYQANGYGRWQAYDGTYYEGEWQNGVRQGWGFSIAPRKPLRVGEWKNDRYKGERLVYTSERIYGIDISKYQHGKGRKKYPINWDRLRITHLGRLSKKTVSGAVNFPYPLHLYQEYGRCLAIESLLQEGLPGSQGSWIQGWQLSLLQYNFASSPAGALFSEAQLYTQRRLSTSAGCGASAQPDQKNGWCRCALQPGKNMAKNRGESYGYQADTLHQSDIRKPLSINGSGP